MAFPTKLSQLCTPAYIYFIVSVLMIVIAVIQNVGNNGRYTLGMFSCLVPSCLLVFALKIVYILFWTWILNILCESGYTSVSWFLFLVPFIILFILIGAIFLGPLDFQ